MPSRSEILEEIRKADPRAQNVPDDELASALAKKYPQYADVLAASTFDKMSISQKAKERLASMKSGPAQAQYEKAQASATQDIATLKGRGYGTLAAAAPFALAPLTGGLSLAGEAAALGGLGLAGGIARESIKSGLGSSEVPKGGDLALALGVDAIAGASGPFVSRGLMLGKTLLPKILDRVAARSDAGKAALLTKFTETRNALYDAINQAAIPKPPAGAVVPYGQTQTGSVFVDVERPMREAYAKIARLPRAKGAFLGGETQLTPEAGQIIRDIEQDLNLQVGIGQMQPLDGLVRAKGNFQQKIYNSRTINSEERKIFQKLAEDLHGIIKTETKALGPEPAALYDKVNELGITLNKATVANTIAEKFINTYTGRLAVGATLGAGEGYRRGGSPTSAAMGAAMGGGAALGVPRLAALILQQTMSHPKAASQLSRALDFAIKGDNASAREISERAFAMAGVRETIKEALKQAPEGQ